MMQRWVLLKEQFGTNVSDYPKAETLHDLQVFYRQHVETMGWSFEVDAISRNDLDWITCCRIVTVEVANGED